DRGLVRVESGLCELTASGRSGSVQLPNSVQVVVSSRIDQLNVSEQLTAKVASVFGRAFDLDGLRGIYPIAVGIDELRSHVEGLVERDLVRLSVTQHGFYSFKHTITQEVAYSLLPYAL